MTNINLYQEPQLEKEKNVMSKIGASVIFSVTMLVFVILAIVSTKFAVSYTQKKNEKMAAEIISENQGLSGQENVQNILDIQVRLKNIKANMENQKKDNVNLALKSIEKEILQGTVVEDFKYEKKSILTTFRSSNFADVSKQLFNLKQSKNFQNIELKNSTRNEKGIEISVDMALSPEVSTLLLQK